MRYDFASDTVQGEAIEILDVFIACSRRHELESFGQVLHAHMGAVDVRVEGEESGLVANSGDFSARVPGRALHQVVQVDVARHGHLTELELEYLASGRFVRQFDVNDAVQASRSHQSLVVKWYVDRWGLGILVADETSQVTLSIMSGRLVAATTVTSVKFSTPSISFSS